MNFSSNTEKLFNFFTKIPLTMRLTFLFLLLVGVCWANDNYAQNARISIDARNQTIAEILETVESQSEFSFIYDSKTVDTKRKVSVQAEEENIFDVLSQMFSGSEIAYTVINNKIILNKGDEMLGIAQQGIRITGTVTDKTGEAMPGVTVAVKGTTLGTISDVNGKYIITVPGRDAVLKFSFIGYTSYESLAGDQTVINITMAEDTQFLDEVVVVGYGVQRKVSVTTAISSINTKDLIERNSTNVNQALQGKLSGLTVIDRGGAPGVENYTMLVRGTTSLNGNTILVLVDGVRIANLSQLNPIDIESVTVLKDAASAAIFGARGAAGVILVTTKAPKDGKLSVSYDGFVGWARPNNNPVHMDAVTYMKHQNAAYMNTHGYTYYTDDYIKQWPTNHANNPEGYPEPNTWQDVLFRQQAPQHSHTLTITGGNDKVTNRISFRYLDQDGILPNFKFNISELKARNEFKLSKKLTFSSNINIRLSERNAPIDETGISNRMFQNSQWGVPYYSDGSYGLSVDNDSPLIIAYEHGFRKIEDTYLRGIFSGEYQLLEPLKLKAQYAIQQQHTINVSFVNKYDFTDKLYPARRKYNTQNSLTNYRNFYEEDEINLQLVYDKTFAKHTLGGTLGYSEWYYRSNDIEGYRRNFYNNDLQVLSMGTDDATQRATGGNTEYGLRSFFSRVTYEYDDRYLLEANARYDGSSRFAKGRKYGFFPSFSAGWRISSENFWEPLKETVNELKLRGSWGSVGNQQVGAYAYMGVYNQSNYIFNEALATGYRLTSLVNSDISWETTTQSDIGLDTYLFGNKINFSLDYYKKRTKDILLVVPIPQMMGLNATNQNAGILDNKGFEFQLGARQSFGDFNVELGFNVNYNQNKVIDLAGTGPHISNTGDTDYRTIKKEGYPIDSFYGFETAGFFQSWDEVNNYAKWDSSVGPGDIKYVDQNGDGELTTDDFVIFGSETPDWTFSSNMSVGWKNLKLDLFWQGVAGSEKLMTGAILEHGIWGGFTHKVWSDYWTPENPNAKYPRPTKLTMKNAQISDFSMLNGKYLRLKNIRLSYDIPKTICNRLNVGGVNVYVSATNLLTFSELNKYNIDAEMIGRGQESTFPQTSVTTVGLSINF